MFGFVRYRSRPEAARAIQNMNNSLLFGNKIRVSMARFKPRYSFWRKVKLGGHNDTMPGEEKEIKKKRDTEKIETSLTDSKEEDRKNEYSLKKPGKIKRVIEVGDEVYMVRASELGFKDVSQIKIQATEKEEGRPDRQTKDSSSEASSADRTMEVNSQKEDALNAAIFGNLKINDYNYDLVETNNHLGESEMKGMEDRINQLETQEHVSTVNERKGEAVVSKIVEKVNGQVEVPAKDLVILNNLQESRVPTSVGLSLRAREELSVMDAVEFANGEESFELSELQYLTKVSKKKERKIGSLSKIQDRFLSEVEKRKRDRVKKRLKKEEIEETISELEGRSITYSDIEARREILLKEAQNTLAVGKTVGIDFIGDEQEP
ncbi:hypothetical protein V6N12_034292 [Hibiscus sabdariffa]|uniref:RRM domain-containing protein n=1 Tax=Hibiscus sabdariffa TaxID=183260 RepID=A0ABR2AMS6_9ROSI